MSLLATLERMAGGYVFPKMKKNEGFELLFTIHFERSILLGLYGETVERITSRGFNRLRQNGEWCVWTCFCDDRTLITSSGQRGKRKNLADRNFLKSEKYFNLIALFSSNIVTSTQENS